ncbi:MAG TPA: DUF4097 family beta strand repeat-containing protein [Gemmatimonadaceae bacterium]|nr:DUF4097 family beta strand repeat-containing protein [Gemmatimonadaceae bacterium]
MRTHQMWAALLLVAVAGASVPVPSAAQERERERNRERNRTRQQQSNESSQNENEDDDASGAAADRRQAGNVDTTVSVSGDVRIVVTNFGGTITVKTWDKNAVRLVARLSRRDYVMMRATESTVRVQSGSRRGVSLAQDYELTVPANADLGLSGTYTDVDVEGVRGAVRVETVQGDVRVRGGSGVVALKSVQGHVSLEDAKGTRVELNATNEGVRVRNVSAERLAVETVNGDIVLDKVDSPDVEGVTVNGNIWYEGTVRDRGQYLFATHNGRVDVGVAEGTNATVSVATYGGQFSSAFPVNRGDDRRSSRRFTFQLGNGSARLDLESFQGGIRLRRPGAAAPRDKGEKDEKDGDDDR